MHKLAAERDWAGKHRILFGTYADKWMKGEYSSALSGSVFCFVIPGACSCQWVECVSRSGPGA